MQQVFEFQDLHVVEQKAFGCLPQRYASCSKIACLGGSAQHLLFGQARSAGDYLNSDSLQHAGAPDCTKPRSADSGFVMQIRQEAAFPCWDKLPWSPGCCTEWHKACSYRRALPARCHHLMSGFVVVFFFCITSIKLWQL